MCDSFIYVNNAEIIFPNFEKCGEQEKQYLERMQNQWKIKQLVPNTSFDHNYNESENKRLAFISLFIKRYNINYALACSRIYSLKSKLLIFIFILYI